MIAAYVPPAPCAYSVYGEQVRVIGLLAPYDGRTDTRPAITVDRSHGAPWFSVSVDGKGCVYVSPL